MTVKELIEKLETWPDDYEIEIETHEGVFEPTHMDVDGKITLHCAYLRVS